MWGKPSNPCKILLKPEKCKRVKISNLKCFLLTSKPHPLNFQRPGEHIAESLRGFYALTIFEPHANQRPAEPVLAFLEFSKIFFAGGMSQLAKEYGCLDPLESPTPERKMRGRLSHDHFEDSDLLRPGKRSPGIAGHSKRSWPPTVIWRFFSGRLGFVRKDEEGWSLINNIQIGISCF